MLRLFLIVLTITAINVCAPRARAERSYSRAVAEQLEAGTKLLRENKLGDARQVFQRVVEVEPSCHEAWNNIGLTFYREGNLDKAGEAYMNAIELEPDFVPSITNLGAVRHQQRQLDKATQLYRLALELSGGKDPEIQYNYANVLRDQKDYPAAREHYRKSIALRPDFPAAHNGLGATYFCLKKFDQAEEEIKQAIKLKPDYALAYYHLGLLESARERYPEAIKAYEKSLHYEDRKDYADDTRAKIIRLKDLMKGSTSGPPLIAKTSPPMSSSSFASQGQSEQVETQLGNAVTKLERLLKSGSNDPKLWNNYGLLLLHEGPDKTDAAIKAFKTSIKLGQGKIYQAHYNLAQAYKNKGDYLSCEKECARAIEIARAQHQVCPLVHNLRAIVLKQKGQFESADHEYKLAIAHSMGKYPVFHYNRALLLEKTNKVKEAKQEYTNYIEKAPNGVNLMKAKLRRGLLGI